MIRVRVQWAEGSDVVFTVTVVMVIGTFALKNFRSRERKFGTFVPGSEKVMEHSFSGTKMTWNFRSQSEYTHAAHRSGIILYQTVTARMFPKYSRNPPADFTQQCDKTYAPNYGDRRAFPG